MCRDEEPVSLSAAVARDKHAKVTECIYLGILQIICVYGFPHPPTFFLPHILKMSDLFI